jgi:hypothetical protein
LNLSLVAATAEKGDSLATTLKRAEWEMSLERKKGPLKLIKINAKPLSGMIIDF